MHKDRCRLVSLECIIFNKHFNLTFDFVNIKGRSKKCTAHGGGRRCQFQECGKAAQSSSNFCVRHGGGKKCVVKGCCKGEICALIISKSFSL